MTDEVNHKCLAPGSICPIVNTVTSGDHCVAVCPDTAAWLDFATNTCVNSCASTLSITYAVILF